MEELEKIDAVRKRAGVSYREAREALEQSGGDVVGALIYLEEKGKRWKERIQVRGAEVVEKVKELIHQGNVTRIRVRQGDRVIVEFPVTVGVVGALLLPVLAALGVVAAMVTNCTIEVERAPEGAPPAGEDGGEPAPDKGPGGEGCRAEGPDGG